MAEAAGPAVGVWGSNTRPWDFRSSFGQKLVTWEQEAWRGVHLREQALQTGNVLSSFLTALEEHCSQTLRNLDFLTVCYLKEYKELILVASWQLIVWYLYLLLFLWF